MSAREELEAVVRAQITRAASHPSSAVMNRATEAILGAADAYAAGDGEALAEARRAVLHRETRP